MRTAPRRSRLTLLPLLLLPALTACAPLDPPVVASAPPPGAGPVAAPADNAAILRAVAGAQRLPANRARDGYRHPVETLSFFGLRGNMTVLELWPGNGWYTEILAPVVADGGKLIVTSVDPDGPQDKGANRAARELRDRMKAEPGVFGKVHVARIDPPAQMDFAPPDSVDLALVIRIAHDWVRDGYADKALASIFRALKPGGTLGVVAHRGKPAGDKPEGENDPKTIGKTGYMGESYVIHIVEEAGFKLVNESEINANPLDVKEYPEGVWTLPPALRLKDKDREKYVAIGESDRMTLRFVKPAAK
jgi:predicted methyltransferase